MCGLSVFLLLGLNVVLLGSMDHRMGVVVLPVENISIKGDVGERFN